MPPSQRLRQFFARFGMVGVLLLLCTIFSVATISDQPVEGAAGARQVASRVARTQGPLLIAAGKSEADRAFAAAVQDAAPGRDVTLASDPAEARAALDSQPPALIAASASAEKWLVFDSVRDRIACPRLSRSPDFLKPENLLNIANQISIIALLAIGMTMVIITRGIDLSVGSLMALSAVLCTWLIANRFGGPQAGAGGILVAGSAAILLCAGAGAFSGLLVTRCRVPAFIATLALMQAAGGAAFKISDHQTINAVPAGFDWLGLRASLGVPNAVWLTLLLYAGAHILMTRTVFGRHIYAVGGNPEAARFSGLSLTRIRLLVHTLCGALAGLGGVVLASQFKSGTANYGQLAELDAIAAAVVGGTSLSGGTGSMAGTLVGALIIGVIRNGMNLKGVDPDSQKIILGAVILAAVLIDQISSRRVRER